MSNSLLNNRHFNKLDVNKLQVNSLLVNNNKSYLYSAIFNNATFKQIENSNYDAELEILESSSIIQFTDRPFTQSSKLNLSQFISLFLSKSTDSFSIDPPNVVLNFNGKQQSFTMIFLKQNNNNNFIFNLKLLNGENHILDNYTGLINLFVDGGNSPVSTSFNYFIKCTFITADAINGYFIIPLNIIIFDNKLLQWTLNKNQVIFYVDGYKQSNIPSDFNCGLNYVSNNNYDFNYNFTITYNAKNYSFTLNNVNFIYNNGIITPNNNNNTNNKIIITQS